MNQGFLSKACSFIDRNFFFVAFAIVVPFAYRFPDIACTGGLIRPEITVFWFDIMAIFFVEGLTLPTAAMVKAMKQFKIHAITQIFALGVIPLVTWAIVIKLQQNGMLSALRDPFLAMATIPSTTSMCVMLSAKCGANAPLAAFNAILSNTIAVAYTPTVLGMLTVTDPNLNNFDLAAGLCFKMVVPQIVGQLLRAKLGAPNVVKNMSKIAKLNQAFILILLFQILSDVFKQGGSVDRQMLLETVMLVFFLHYLFFALSWMLGGLFKLGPRNRVAFLFSSTTKTVVLGVPMLRTIYANRSPGDTAILLLPLISYHFLELVNGLMFVNRIRAWLGEQDGDAGEGGDGVFGEAGYIRHGGRGHNGVLDVVPQEPL